MFDLNKIRIEHVIVIGILVWFFLNKKSKEGFETKEGFALHRDLIEVKVPIVQNECPKKIVDNRRKREGRKEFRKKCKFNREKHLHHFNKEDVEKIKLITPHILEDIRKEEKSGIRFYRHGSRARKDFQKNFLERLKKFKKIVKPKKGPEYVLREVKHEGHVGFFNTEKY